MKGKIVSNQKTKKIKDAELGAKRKWFEEQTNTYEIGEMVGEKNAPPLELTEELNAQLVEEEKEKEEKQEEVRGNTKTSTNGVNEWRLIAKTINHYLGWEHTTMAMEAGDGCLVMVKEAIGQKMHSTMTYVPGVDLLEDDDPDSDIGWIIFQKKADIDMSKDPKYFDIQRLVVYSELLTKMIYDIDDVGMRATRASQSKIIEEKSMKEIHNKLVPIVENIESKRIAIVKELNKRVKNEVGLTKGPTDLDEFLHSFKKDYSDIYLTKEEFDFKKSQQANEEIKTKAKSKLKKVK